MISYILIVSATFPFLAFLIIRLAIYFFSQKHTQCKVCKSFDTERVERGFFIKKVLFMSKTHKYWCRKCWNNFYVRH